MLRTVAPTATYGIRWIVVTCVNEGDCLVTTGSSPDPGPLALGPNGRRILRSVSGCAAAGWVPSCLDYLLLIWAAPPRTVDADAYNYPTLQATT
ncbi:hypothetical protein RP20_CCG009111 [Aedes albopictus]|nr:hypothetical protein RP20_CCG009111 [Aedes albopictus]